MTGPGPLAGGRKSSPVGRSGTQAVALSGAKLGGPWAAYGGARPAPRQSAANAPVRNRIGRHWREASFDIEALSLVLRAPFHQRFVLITLSSLRQRDNASFF